MFDKEQFAHIIKKIKDTYNSQEEFSKKSNIGRTYLSQYMNMKLKEPPKPKILEKLANASNGITTYTKLMQVCGYTYLTDLNSSYTLMNMEDLDENDIEEINKFIEFVKNKKKNKNN